MDITGRIIEVLPEESGVSKAGKVWKKVGYILETFDTYPKKVKITVFGRNCDNVHMEAGRAYTVSVDVESREFNGRWYTDVNGYAARETEMPGVGGSQPVQQGGNPFGQQPAAAPAASAAAPAANTFAPNDPFASAPASQGAAGANAFGDSSDDLPF